MVIWFEFHLGKHRNYDHREDAPHFINCKFLKIGVHDIIHILAYYPCFGKQIEQSNSRVQ